jgi:CRP-like cAMP-binding protein
MSEVITRDLNAASRASVFRNIKRGSLRYVLDSASIIKIDRGRVLFRQGDAASAIFIIIRGGIKLYQNTAMGHEAIIDILARGQAIAIVDAFYGRRHNTNAEAISNARLLRVPLDSLVRCISTAPDVALTVMASAFADSQRFMRQIAQFKSQTASQRLAEFLCALSSVDVGPCVFTLPYDKTLIAGQLGIAPESLSRAFARLKSIGVDVQETCVKVRDVRKLRRFKAG